ALAARVHELASAQKDLNAGLIFVFVLSLFLGLFFFSFFFGLALLVLFGAPPHPLAFLFLFFFVERLAVLFHQRGNFIAVQVAKRGFALLVPLHFSRAVVFGFFFRFGARVVFLELVDRFLVVVDFLEKC